jgi:hypothetical protein
MRHPFGGQRKQTQPPPARSSDPVLQDIRLAVVLNGGVSLAIWISGVTHELNGLVQASRRRGTAMPTKDPYADLLGVLKANARIDVIAGTSAGGINGGFLSLGLVRGCDLSGLRTLWQEQGDLGTLLRSPREENPPSLLRGVGGQLGLPGSGGRGRRPVPDRHPLGRTPKLLRRRHGTTDHGDQP